MNKLQRGMWYGLMLVPLLFFALFFAYPLLAIFEVSFFPDGSPDLSGFVELIEEPYYREVIWFTLYQSVLSTVITVSLAIPAAYVFTRYRFRAKQVILSFTTLPFVLPTIVVATAFSSLLGENGLVNDFLVDVFRLDPEPIKLEGTLAFILIIHVFYNFSIAFRMIAGYWNNQSHRIEEVAKTLGATEWELWRTIRLPLIRPAILSSAILVFIFAFTSFGIVLIFGGLRFETIEVVIYKETVYYLNPSLSGALSLVQLLTMSGVMIVYTRLQRDVRVSLVAENRANYSTNSLMEKLVVYSTILCVAIFLFLPLLTLVARSLVNNNGTFSLVNYTNLLNDANQTINNIAPPTAMMNSLVFAGLTMIVAVLLGTLVSYLVHQSQARVKSLLDPFFILPLATSAVTLGFGFIIALDEPPLNLRTSWVLIPIAHTLVAMPFVVRSVLPALRVIPRSLNEASSVLGASPVTTWLRVELPIISRGLLVGATFSFTISMGEFGASLFIARPEATTLPIAIYRLLGRPGIANYGQAMALSVVLMGVCALSFFIIERVRSAGVGGVLMLSLQKVNFAYADEPVVDDVSLTVSQGEIVCLLGPSGCGKTTLLRLIAGLEKLQGGDITIDGTSLHTIPVHKRGFGLMFQDFALFPHMSVGDNIAYGLKLKRMSRDEIQNKVDKFLRIVGLTNYNDRDITQLSGGEQQRVALARCLVAEPKLLMLDEPLGALDARLRNHLMVELRDIIKQVGVTAIYVTHDQSEAFAVADRIVVMNNGNFEQIDTPIEVYNAPKTVFVASFLGMNNFLPINNSTDLYVETPIGRFSLDCPYLSLDRVLLHPDGLYLNDTNRLYQLEGKIETIVFWGDSYQLTVSTESGIVITLSVPSFRAVMPEVGKMVMIGFDASAFVCLDN